MVDDLAQAIGHRRDALAQEREVVLVQLAMGQGLLALVEVGLLGVELGADLLDLLGDRGLGRRGGGLGRLRGRGGLGRGGLGGLLALGVGLVSALAPCAWARTARSGFAAGPCAAASPGLTRNAARAIVHRRSCLMPTPSHPRRVVVRPPPQGLRGPRGPPGGRGGGDGCPPHLRHRGRTVERGGPGESRINGAKIGAGRSLTQRHPAPRRGGWTEGTGRAFPCGARNRWGVTTRRPDPKPSQPCHAAIRLSPMDTAFSFCCERMAVIAPHRQPRRRPDRIPGRIDGVRSASGRRVHPPCPPTLPDRLGG